MRMRISPEQAQRLFREYAEAPADAKMPDGWHLNRNRVPIPPPPTGLARDRAIAKRRHLAGPEMAADPRYTQNGTGWDEVFATEHEMCQSFFCSGSPPEWFTRESVSPPGSDDPDMAREEEDFYVRRPEEIFAPSPRFPGPTPPRDPALPRPTIINGDTLIFID
jgi:hypothetical protein